MMLRALQAEFAKLKRESVVWWTVATVLFAPALSNVFATAQDSGLRRISWSAFFGLGSMTMGTWYGILLFGLIAAFLFGREYAHGIAPSMLTAPTRREYFVIAKLVVLAVWVFSLTLLALIAQGVMATVLGFDGFAWGDVWPIVGDLFTVALLIFLTLPVVALIAMVARGVFAPMIFSAAGFLAGMIGGIAKWGEWLPWAMPTAIAGSFIGAPITGGMSLSGWSWTILSGMFTIGVAGMLWWVDNADAQV